ncbi:VPDSG-CTERM sorting domain-containing protein [Pelagicoccus mobilis]|uniref:VPDSG-CTERM sorting domain-containing protein n=1 Tax=Pelagicoccus mobilis TaxID=415221 RepID=A0A934RSS9_9BACT|nr:VPDSG-CTERM sorting domain-containing protein [Pelagicoccus mobilis]MBK1875773.1 VPDSG-CTERM sorting domain-containing protein [Pelagicoccus mobilis]
MNCNLLQAKITRCLLISIAAVVSSLSAYGIAFDVTGVGGGNTTHWANAEGISGSAEWSISGFASWKTNTTTTDNSTVFSGGNFSPALANSDRLHTFGSGFVISFDRNIHSILFYLKENSSQDTPLAILDLGLVPTLVSGSVGISGTQVTGTVAGGVVRFSGLNTDTLTHTARARNAMDVAWVVESASKVPDTGSTVLLLGVSIIGLATIRRKFCGR